MALSETRLEEILSYCRIPPAEELPEGELALVEVLYDAAVQYMAEAGVAESEDSRYRLCVNALVLDLYDNRGSQSTQNLQTFENPTFRRMLNQLKLDAAVHVSNSDTCTAGEA